MLRYDAYRDNIEMQDNGKTISLLKRDYIRAEINGEKYAIFSFNAENERAKQGYFVQLTSGPLILLKKITKEFKPATETTSTYKREQPPRFADDIEYYLFSSNEEVAKSIKLRKKSILKVLDNEMEASKIIKERKLDLSEENGVIQMITILNSTTNNSK
jgi:hypothetical protein